MASSGNDKILVHQAIHGYSEGHRLLEASKSLPMEIDRRMLLLSDMSGPSMVHGFKEYLTGYPVQEIGSYALARTWHAPEMDRPGCVWTHTLIIENADLARIKDLRILLTLFARPQKGRSFSSYRSPLTAPKRTGLAPGLSSELSDPAMLTLSAIYGSPARPVIIPTEGSDIYENLVMAIWSQQWPRLRRAFWFCTGSISSRVINGHTFDLQIVPKRQLSHITLGSPADSFAIIKRSDRSKYQKELPEWLDATTKDLFEDKGTSLRSFLWRFGAESSKGRATFTELVKIFLAIELHQKGTVRVQQIIELVGKCFPTTDDFPSLKKAIFGEVPDNHERVSYKINEVEVLRGFSVTTHNKAFDPESLSLFEQAQKLAKRSTQEAITTVLKIPLIHLNPLQEIILQGLIKGLELVDIVAIAEQRPEILSTILKNNPNWAASGDIWKLPAGQQNRVWSAIGTNLELDQEILNSIVSSMLDEESDEVSEDISYRYVDRAIKAVLAWLDSRGDDVHLRPPGRWLTIIRSEPSLLLHRLEKSPEPSIATKAIMSEVLDPNSREVYRCGADIWLPLAKAVYRKKGVNPPSRTMVFLLALGFNNPGPKADEIVADSFEAVHDLAGTGQLSYDYWGYLNKHTSKVLSWWYWDKCRLLRETLVDKFIIYEWPIKSFLESARNADTFRMIVECCQESLRRRKFLGKVVEEAHKHKTFATKAQLETLSRIL